MSIACLLLGIIMSVLIGYYRSLLKTKGGISEKKELVETRSSFRSLLSPIFSQILPPNPENKLHPLYIAKIPESSSPALYFSYDAGLDSDPKFSHELTGCIFVNKDHELCLVRWPLDGSARVQLVMKNVASLEWQFLTNSDFEWTESWTKKDKAIPSAIKMVVHEKNLSTVEYCFLLPQSQREVTYR